MVPIVYEDAQCLVAVKAAGVPVQPDPTGDESLLSMVEAQLSQPLYLIHRLDRAVGGVVVFAKTRAAAASLSLQVREHTVEKCYLAITEGTLAPEGELCDLLFHDKRRRMAFVVDRKREGVKEARLHYRTVATHTVDGRERHLLAVTLDTGRFHQIRAQLASRSCPLLGDGKYGSRQRCPLALFATRLTFDSKQGRVSAHASPDTAKAPWSEFQKEIEDLCCKPH